MAGACCNQTYEFIFVNVIKTKLIRNSSLAGAGRQSEMKVLYKFGIGGIQ